MFDASVGRTLIRTNELVRIDEHVRHIGRARELFVVGNGSRGEQRIALAAGEASRKRVVIDVGGARFGRAHGVLGTGFIHASEERHLTRRVREVKSAECRFFPVAIALFDTGFRRVADRREHLEIDIGILIEVLVNMDEILGTKVLAPGSFGSEKVPDGVAASDS